MIDCTNYVIMHRPYPVNEDGMYKKLCVGNYCEASCLTEKDGENIAQYNDRLNELTGLYWIWKNTDCEYVGLSHYRRFFNNCGHRLDRIGVEDILVEDGYDIILAPKRLNWCLAENLRKAVGMEMAVRAMRTMMAVMRKRQPEYEDALAEVLNDTFFYYCNLFVTRRDILDDYCDWLFSFITEAADLIDITGADRIQQRTAGYLGEMMMSVWLKRHKELRVYELPVEVVYG